MNKVLVIVGPTASGKSDLAVKLARKFKGEIISADSRQVYKRLNHGTGKITKKEMWGVPHHLLDVANPRKYFSVSDYKKLGMKKMGEINLPIIVGGTGLYIDALTGQTNFPEVPPNFPLRKKLEKKSAEQLWKILEKQDPKRAKTIDRHNKVRLIRALEIVSQLGKIPVLTPSVNTSDFVFIGLKPDNLDERIRTRLLKRMPSIIREVKRLHSQGLSWRRMYELGLEYRYVSQYAQGKLDKEEMIEKLFIESKRYAKRQMTWWKRNKNIRWFTLSEVEGLSQAEYKQIEKYARIALKGD